MIEEMQKDPQYRQLIQRHHGSLSIVHEQEELQEQQGHLRKAIHVMKQDIVKRKSNIADQLDQVMMRTMIASMDVAEFYSPPRIASMAAKMGLRAGWSLDISTHGKDGRAWDFNIPEMRNRAARMVLTDKPVLLIGSPMCTIPRCHE